jgi:hypothetical protein
MNTGKINILTSKSVNNIKYLYKMIDYLDLKGKNSTLFYPKSSFSNKSENTYLEAYINQSKIPYSDLEDLSEKINNKSNLFRTNIVILDLWNNYLLDPKILDIIKYINDKFLIIITKNIPNSLLKGNLKHIITDDYYYSITINNEDILIEDLKNNLVYNYSYLIKSDIREIKLNKLFE